MIVTSVRNWIKTKTGIFGGDLLAKKWAPVPTAQWIQLNIFLFTVPGRGLRIAIIGWKLKIHICFYFSIQNNFFLNKKNDKSLYKYTFSALFLHFFLKSCDILILKALTYICNCKDSHYQAHDRMSLVECFAINLKEIKSQLYSYSKTELFKLMTKWA